MNQQKEAGAGESVASREEIIALMDVYLGEWEHRDTLLWKQVFRYFYATLFVTILPNIAKSIGIDLPNLNSKVFPIIGLGLSLIFLYVGLGYAVRLRASSRTYEKMMKLLKNPQYERISIKDGKSGKKSKLGVLLSVPMAYVLVVTMFAALVAVAILFFSTTTVSVVS